MTLTRRPWKSLCVLIDRSSAGLGCWKNQQITDIDVSRPGNHKNDDLSYILGCQRLIALVDLFGPFHISFEPHQGKLSFYQTRIDRSNLDTVLVEIQAHALIQSVYGVL